MISKIACLFSIMLFARTEARSLLVTRGDGDSVDQGTKMNYVYEEIFGKENKQDEWNITEWKEDKSLSAQGKLSYINWSPPSEGIRFSGQLPSEDGEEYYGQTCSLDKNLIGNGNRLGFSLIVDPLSSTDQIDTFFLEFRDQTSARFEARFQVPVNKIEFKTYPIRVKIPFTSFSSANLDVQTIDLQVIKELGFYVRGPTPVDPAQNKEKHFFFDLMIKQISVYSG